MLESAEIHVSNKIKGIFLRSFKTLGNVYAIVDTLDLLAVEMIMPFQIALLLFLIMVKVLFIFYLFTYRF